MPRLKRPEAVVFDLDGTLVDTAPDLCAATNTLLKEHGRTPVSLDDLRQMVGDGAAAMIARGFAATGGMPADIEPLVRRFLEIYHGAIADFSKPFPGVVDVLTRFAAHGIRLGVCTNKSTFGTERLLTALDLTRHFSAIVGGDGPSRKPDPRHLLETVTKLGADPRHTLMVGDSSNDVNAARGAGIPVVAVTFGYTAIHARDLGADAVIDHFSELPGLIGLV